MDTRRNRIRQVFEGAVPARPPVSMRMDIWHTHAVGTGTLPAEIRGLTVEQVEDYLGFCRSARYRTRIGLKFPPDQVTQRTDGEFTTTTYNLRSGRLEKVYRHTQQEKSAGMTGTTVKYPVCNERECRILLDSLVQAELEGDFGGFDAFDGEVGEAGLPMLILGECPAGHTMLHLMGYESFFYAMADYPALLDNLITHLEERFREQIWPKAFRSKAEIILHGTHFSDATTPPPLFRQYILPYFQEFNEQAHRAGKYVLWHADAGMGLLLADVLQAGFDGADCLATAPLVPETIDDYYAAWQGRIVCWGGLPGIIFNPEYPELDFRRDLDHLCRFSTGKPGFIIGVSDNLMPAALWERILAVRDAFL